jgi:t-SNARE complex subunit (syntaxin)
VISGTAEAQQIARRLSNARGRDTAARHEFDAAMGRTRRAMEDTAAALQAVAPRLPRAHYEKLQREYTQASKTVTDLEARARKLMQEGERADAEAAAAAAAAAATTTGGAAASGVAKQQVEMTFKSEDPQRAIIEERNREMARLAEDIGALREMMHDASKLVGEQGTALDTAAANVKHADMEVAQGTHQTKLAERLKQRWRLLMVILVIVVLLIITAIVLIVLKATDVI